MALEVVGIDVKFLALLATTRTFSIRTAKENASAVKFLCDFFVI